MKQNFVSKCLVPDFLMSFFLENTCDVVPYKFFQSIFTFWFSYTEHYETQSLFYFDLFYSVSIKRHILILTNKLATF
jgi:hypothetical protein